MSELEFVGALHVELLRRSQLGAHPHRHELFQTSTIAALLEGAFDGDVSVSDILEHGDLGLGTLNGLDGELIVIDGEAWKADRDCTLTRVPGSCRTPYAVVVSFSPGAPVALEGPLHYGELERAVRHRLRDVASPAAIRLDGSFERVRVRSVMKQQRPYPPLAEALADQHAVDLNEVSGSMVGFGFPSALDGIEMIGWHLHFATEDRGRGGHVLDFALRHGFARVDDATALNVELPPAVDLHRETVLDQDALRRLETDSSRVKGSHRSRP